MGRLCFALTAAAVVAPIWFGSHPAGAQAPLPLYPVSASARGSEKPTPPKQPPVAIVEVGEENEQAIVDRALKAWHAAAAKTPAFTVEFTRFDVAMGAPSPVRGRICYVAPAHGSYESEGKIRWVYDGRSVFEFHHGLKQVREHRLTADDYDTPVTAGPFPLLYAPDPQQMRARYRLRPITPAGVTDELWIEARPKTAADYQMCDRAEFILTLPEHRLYAMNLIHLDGGGRTSFVFDALRPEPWNDVLGKIGRYLEVPADWEFRVIEPAPSLQTRRP